VSLNECVFMLHLEPMVMKHFVSFLDLFISGFNCVVFNILIEFLTIFLHFKLLLHLLDSISQLRNPGFICVLDGLINCINDLYVLCENGISCIFKNFNTVFDFWNKTFYISPKFCLLCWLFLLFHLSFFQFFLFNLINKISDLLNFCFDKLMCWRLRISSLSTFIIQIIPLFFVDFKLSCKVLILFTSNINIFGKTFLEIDNSFFFEPIFLIFRYF